MWEWRLLRLQNARAIKVTHHKQLPIYCIYILLHFTQNTLAEQPGERKINIVEADIQKFLIILNIIQVVLFHAGLQT